MGSNIGNLPHGKGYEMDYMTTEDLNLTEEEVEILKAQMRILPDSLTITGVTLGSNL